MLIAGLFLLTAAAGAVWVRHHAREVLAAWQRPAGIDATLPSSAPFHVRVRPTTTSKPTIPHLYGTLLTPQTMRHEGFDVQCRFYDSTVTRGNAPTTRTGMVRVLVVFNPVSGPKIKEVKEISLLLFDQQGQSAAVPVQSAVNASDVTIQFWIDDRMFDGAFLSLTVLQGIHGRAYLVPIDAFDR